jgi:hypothetical protein
MGRCEIVEARAMGKVDPDDSGSVAGRHLLEARHHYVMARIIQFAMSKNKRA